MTHLRHQTILATALILGTGCLGLSGAAFADDKAFTYSGNVALTTDYILRGVSQTQHRPAIQGGLEIDHASGLYAGIWGSNVNWVEALNLESGNSLELDVYGGYRGSVKDIGYDLGVVTYRYPGTDLPGPTPNTTEAYIGLNWKMLSLKYNYAVSQYFVGWTDSTGTKDSRGSSYIDLTGNFDLTHGWTLVGHVGHQFVRNVNQASPFDASYTDWKVGIAKDTDLGNFSVAYTDTNADKGSYTWAGKDIANGRVSATWTKSF